MGQTPPRAATQPALDRFISTLYCRGAEIPAERFRRWALTELRGLLDFDAAVWGSGPAQQPQFHNVTVVGVPTEFSRALESSQTQNPLLPLIQQDLGQPVDMSDALADDEFYISDLYRRTFQPFGIERILSSAHLERRSGLYTLLSIYRFDRDRSFTQAEREVQGRVLHHLVRAAALVFFLAISRPQQPGRRGFNAVCDARGVFHEVEDGFLELLETHYPGWPGEVLPFAMPAGNGSRLEGGLSVSVAPLDDLFLVHLRESGPLDALTEREREVVTRVCQGLSAKAIGRTLGVAPSTVSTHLYRAYRKLGVENRTALAQLIQGLQ